ncbi:Sulfotransferase 1 family member D1 [Lamellibrachia satsuma]|nr:Sulfotransferase 1 family member D1 [Lamellibrachia satsuma]
MSWTATCFSGRYPKQAMFRYVPYGPWSDHVISYWKHRDDSNILFITYEELQKNPVAVVKQIATFLGKDFDQSQLEKVVDHCSFKKMKKNPAANWMEPNGLAKKNRKTDFFRKGEVGDWVNYFDVKMCEDMDKACADRTKAEGLKFVYKL